MLNRAEDEHKEDHPAAIALRQEIEALPAELRQATKELWQKTDAIINSFQQPIKETPPPALIFHYTDDIGLRGILDTGTLWLHDGLSSQ
jgi:hypothetical protein